MLTEREWTTLLSFQFGNAKLAKRIATFSIPAGWTCPGASECLARANRQTGLIMDGADQRFRCFSAMAEVRPNVRDSRWTNLELLRAAGTPELMASLICASLPDCQICRIHVGGDFYSSDYFRAWCKVAQTRPDIIFYAYTKSVDLWVANRHLIPSNLRLTASRGGKFDHLIDLHGLKTAEVVFSVKAAAKRNLPLDHDESHAYARSASSFAMLLHGSQPAGSEASKALSALKRTGWTGYSHKKN